MINIPNMNKEILTNNFEGVPLIWNVNQKNLKQIFKNNTNNNKLIFRKENY